MKNVFVVLFAAFMSFAAAADTGGPSVKVDILVTKAGALVVDSSVTTSNGVGAPISAMRETTYVAAASKNAEGHVTLTPGAIRTGFMATVVPLVQSNGRIRTQVSMSISELVGMGRRTIADGMTVDEPKLGPVLTLTNDVVIHQAEPTILYSGDYRVQIMATAI